MKPFLRYAFAILLVLILVFFTANYIISNKVNNLLEREPNLTYNSLSVNSLTGHLDFEDVMFKDSTQDLTVKSIALDVDLLDYFLNKKILIKDLSIDELNLTHNLSAKKEINQKDNTFQDSIIIENIYFKNSKISLQKNNSNIFEASKVDMRLKELTWPLKLNYNELDDKILSISANDLFYDFSKLHRLSSTNFNLENKTANFLHFKIEPNYSRAEYINHIETEKDLMNLSTKRLSILELDILEKEEKTFVEAQKIQVDSTDFFIYRDKSIADDTSEKPLYSESLRNLKWKLRVDSIAISELNLTYQELIDQGRKPGEITFNSIHGHIFNLHNVLNHQKPDIKTRLKARFTKASNIYFDLNIVPDHDNFTISTQLTQIEDSSINSFFAPAMRMELDGEINLIETSMNGNHLTSQGDFLIAYEKLKLNVLNKNGSKNSFASLLSNAFLKNKNVKDSFDLKEVRRDKTKSFWNYVWTFHLEGLKKSLL